MSIYIEEDTYSPDSLIEDIDLLIFNLRKQKTTGHLYCEPGFQFYDDVYSLLCNCKKTASKYRLDFETAIGYMRAMLTSLHEAIIDERDPDYGYLTLLAGDAKEAIETEAADLLAVVEREREEDNLNVQAGVPVGWSA